MIETARVLSRDGVATGVRRSGTHGPALVFVHGVGSTGAIWDRQLRSFAGEARCYAIELRGNGVPKPEPDPARITRMGFAEDVLAVADDAGVDRFTLIGCSLGGVVAFELMRHAPERIEALVILGSFARYPDGQAYADGIAEAVNRAGNMPAFARERSARLGLAAERLAETLEQMACKSVSSYLAATQATWTGDYRGMLHTIRVPTLVTYGARDLVAPAELSEEIARGIPGAACVRIDAAGHVANADNPAAFDAALRTFLTRETAIRVMP